MLSIGLDTVRTDSAKIFLSHPPIQKFTVLSNAGFFFMDIHVHFCEDETINFKDKHLQLYTLYISCRYTPIVVPSALHPVY